MGLVLLSIGVLMARQRLMKPRKRTHNLSPYLIGSDAWKVDTMIESLGSSSRTDPSRGESVSAEPHLAVGGSSGHCSGVQTADSALSYPADSGSCVESSAEPSPRAAPPSAAPSIVSSTPADWLAAPDSSPDWTSLLALVPQFDDEVDIPSGIFFSPSKPWRLLRPRRR